MPIVGIVERRGHPRRDLGRAPLPARSRNSPRASSALGVGEQPVGRGRRPALRVIAAEHRRGLRRQPDVTHHRHARGDNRGDARRCVPAPSILTASAPASFTKPDRVGRRRARRRPGTRRTAGRRRRAAARAPRDDRARQHQHLVHRDRRRRVQPEHRHRGGVADEDGVDAGAIGQARAGRVVRRDHRDLAAAVAASRKRPGKDFR